MVLWPCHQRMISLLFADIVISLTLLWTLFFEQYSDKILLKIKFYLHQKVEGEVEMRREVLRNERFIIIPSSRSFVFIMQIIFASIPFIATLLSYKHRGIEEKKNDFHRIL